MRFYVRAVSYFLPDWPLVCVWVFLVTLSTAVGLLVAWPMAILIDSVLESTAKHDWIHRLFLGPLPHNPIGRLLGLAAAGFAIKLLQDLLSAVLTLVCNHINYNGLMRVRCDLYRKLQAMSMAYHKSQPQGDTIYRLSSDTYGCQIILGILVSTTVAAVTLVGMFYILSTRSLSLTLSAFTVVPFLAIANIAFGRRFRARSLDCKERDSEFTTAVQRSMSCIGLVQAFGREAEEFSQFRGAVRETIRAGWGLNREQIVYNILVGTLFGIGGAIVFGYGGYLVYHGMLSLGELIVFTSYLGLLWGPLCTLTGFYASIQQGVASAERVFEILDRDQVIADEAHARPLPCRPRVLELDDVGFSYAPTAKPVLERLSARIEPGQMVAFVGSSGVGKSTLLNLLPRFYDPTSGTLRFDGIDAREVRLADLRRHVALVLQESVILPTTIAENIAYGRPGASLEQIREAARLAGAAEFIAALPQGYDTPTTEGGQSMSGGQRQRIAIARALLTEAPIIVLDEPTSALDPLHERLVTDALGNLKGKRTIILVSHRLSTVRGCDQIFVMERGRVAESGTHEQLIALGGIYAMMVGQQVPMTAADLPTAA
jgi:ATP-binding cassette subfamily B protein